MWRENEQHINHERTVYEIKKYDGEHVFYTKKKYWLFDIV